VSFLKNVAQMGASFIPGVGPLVSAGIGALGSSGKQGQQNYNSNQNSSTTSNQTQNIDQFNEAIEDEEFSGFRKSLLPMMQQEMSRAQRPIYGDAQKTQHLANLNDLASASMNSLKSSLAGRGVMDSGAFNESAAGIERDRFGKAVDFETNLPFMEEQARSQRMGGLMGMATQFAGRAPISTRSTGTNSSNGTQNTTGTSTGSQSQQGSGLWNGFLQNMGGLMAANVGRPGTVPTLNTKPQAVNQDMPVGGFW
jgi:hypothetical protein